MDTVGAFSPLASRAFRALWIATLVSNIGTWMQTVGAQWFLVGNPQTESLVAFVQAAAALPMALLAIPSGVLADQFNRRTILLTVQTISFVTALALTFLHFTNTLNAAILLSLTTVLGITSALTFTPFQSLIPDLVPRHHIRAAAALNPLSLNTARVIGPAIAGLVIAKFGITPVFAINAASFLFFVLVLLRWRPTFALTSEKRERFFPAIRSGLRYVRHSPQITKLMLRSFWFTSPMMAIWALLPLISTQLLNLDSDGYGLLITALGGGAIIGATANQRLRRRFTTNAIIATATALEALVILLLPYSTNRALSMTLLGIAGLGWTSALASMAGAMQIYLPAWVRARGLATYSVALFGGQAVGALIIGRVNDEYGLHASFLFASIVMAIGSTQALWRPLKELDDIDRSPALYWPEPELVIDPARTAEVNVSITYWIDESDEPAFFDAMEHVRRTRLRTGGYQWGLYRDGETPRRFVETYSVSSWEEHEHQHAHRLVQSDRVVEERVIALSNPPREIKHLFREELGRK